MNIIQMLPYILGVEAVVFCVVFVWIVYHFKLRIVYRAEFFRKSDRSTFGARQLVKVGQKDFKPDKKEICYKKHDYPILFDKMASTDGRVHKWAFELDDNVGLTFGGSHDIGDPSLLGDILYSGTLKRFANLVGAVNVTTWILIAVFIAIAVLAFVSGLFASPYILPPVEVPVS